MASAASYGRRHGTSALRTLSPCGTTSKPFRALCYFASWIQILTRRSYLTHVEEFHHRRDGDVPRRGTWPYVYQRAAELSKEDPLLIVMAVEDPHEPEICLKEHVESVMQSVLGTVDSGGRHVKLARGASSSTACHQPPLAPLNRDLANCQDLYHYAGSEVDCREPELSQRACQRCACSWQCKLPDLG